MIIDVFHDTVCPWCRIGKANLYKALEQWDGEKIELVWRSYMLDPSVPVEGLPFLKTMQEKYGAQFSMDGMLGRVVEAGKSAGVHFDFEQVTYMPNTMLSHRLIALAPEAKRTELVEAINVAYFEQGRNIGEREQLMRIAADLELDVAELSAQLDRGDGQAQVEEDFALARRIGISGVPFFVIGRKLGLSGAQPPAAFLEAFRRVTSPNTES